MTYVRGALAPALLCFALAACASQPQYPVRPAGPPAPPAAAPAPTPPPVAAAPDPFVDDAPRALPSTPVQSQALAPITGTALAPASPSTTATESPSQAPAATPPTPSAAATGPVVTSHLVTSGETLFGLARRYGVGAKALADANGLTLESHVKIGQRLKLPAGARDRGPQPVPVVVAPPAATQTAQADTGSTPAASPATAPSSAGAPTTTPTTSPPAGPAPASSSAAAARSAAITPPAATPASPRPSRPASTPAPAPRATTPPVTTPRPSAPASTPPATPRPPAPSTTTPTATPPSTTAASSAAAATTRPVVPPSGPATTPQQIAALGKGKFQWPVKGNILSGFGPKGAGQRNDGLNIAGSRGDSVRAAAAGEVVYSGSSIPGFGTLVLIKHDGGWVTAYAHMDASDVKMKQRVLQGDRIGSIGATGSVSQPQLHFEVRYAPSSREKATPIDPALVLPGG